MDRKIISRPSVISKPSVTRTVVRPIVRSTIARKVINRPSTASVAASSLTNAVKEEEKRLLDLQKTKFYHYMGLIDSLKGQYDLEIVE